jgi:hypothetical protein
MVRMQACFALPCFLVSSSQAMRFDACFLADGPASETTDGMARVAVSRSIAVLSNHESCPVVPIDRDILMAKVTGPDHRLSLPAFPSAISKRLTGLIQHRPIVEPDQNLQILHL